MLTKTTAKFSEAGLGGRPYARLLVVHLLADETDKTNRHSWWLDVSTFEAQAEK